MEFEVFDEGYDMSTGFPNSTGEGSDSRPDRRL